ncbi:MAG: tRNA-(ms[2]io[6]A)-hydroxylase [Myxococcota bacterium]
MLHLAHPTAPPWAPWALTQLDEILLDHAHCEKKAASTAINLIFRYQDKLPLMVPLSRLAREELAHFELVLGHVHRRGGTFGRQQPSGYAGRLMQCVRAEEPKRLLDTLLCCAMIEARSCERMQLLGAALETDGRDPELTALYQGLLASEARHHASYLDLIRALELTDEAGLKSRLAEVAAHEADVIASAPAEARLHSGYAASNSTSA